MNAPKTRRRVACAAGLLLCAMTTNNSAAAAPPRTWTADNGNGTYTNPLFYDEFSDPDLIRVGDDYYLTGTTMHAMPGLPVLHSKDLVNWRFLSYACERLDLGPEYRLEGGRDIYGQGFWAPCLRYHNGTFYIFSNVNRQTTQVFRATNPAGPWTHTKMDVGLHDLSVLFDDGKIYAVWGYRDLKLARLKDDLSGIVPGTEKHLFPRDSLMGEGVHFYKIDGKYYLTSAWYDGKMRMACARADRPEGPWEVNPAISMGEDFGLGGTNSLVSDRFRPPFKVNPPAPGSAGRRALHQGGVVSTPKGETWGFSMIDYNAVGRVTCLAPVTWKDGWPYFGLPGNLGRAPRVWVKPDTGHESPSPVAPYERADDFSGPGLNPVWQWNHAPENTKWSLTERTGHLRLHALPAPDFWTARNTLTQRAIGPESTATTVLDAGGMKPGDVAGLALLNLPYAWIGVRRGAEGGLILERYDQTTGETASAPLKTDRVWLRARCDFRTETATFHYSTDGTAYSPLGGEFAMVFQLKTFQGVRYALFNYHAGEGEGGHADFDGFMVDEPRPRGLTRPIPLGQTITLASVAPGGAVLAAARHEIIAVAPDDRRVTPEATGFTVVDRGRGRVALRCGDAYVSVLASGSAGQVLMAKGEPTERETFQWVETPFGDLALLSLASHRYLRIDPRGNVLSADSPGPPPPGRDDGTLLAWKPTQATP
ncbi:MAG TPA: glycoside hydrolase 43 family protein [Armatimonadaceae bacterium]|nr:glycoside hydrolase 43 family protein [Armatimonadaceae bacterium]